MKELTIVVDLPYMLFALLVLKLVMNTPSIKLLLFASGFVFVLQK